MKITILGAGQVGSSVARILAYERNDVTVVDTNGELLKELQDRLDIGVVQGLASHPAVLSSAGAEDADMIVAVTNSDEVNMVACQVAWTLFRTPTKIARVRSSDYLNARRLFGGEALPIDVCISPEQSVTDSIRSVIENPGALQVLDFADGRVRLVCVKAVHGGALVGHALHNLRQHMPGTQARVAAIFRHGQPSFPRATRSYRPTTKCSSSPRARAYARS